MFLKIGKSGIFLQTEEMTWIRWWDETLTVCVVDSKRSNVDVYQRKILVQGAQSDADELPRRRPGVNNDPTTVTQLPPWNAVRRSTVLFTCACQHDNRGLHDSHIINVLARGGGGGGGDAGTTGKWSSWARKPQQEAATPMKWSVFRSETHTHTGNLWLRNVGNSVLCTCCFGRRPKLYDITGSAQPFNNSCVCEMESYI